MIPDSIVFTLVSGKSSIRITTEGRVVFLMDNEVYNISDTNLGRFLVECMEPRPKRVQERPMLSHAIQ